MIDPLAPNPVSPAEIARVFLKIGAMSYGGPAIMGIMQAEIQEKRKWIDRKTFVDGLALVNMPPGPGAAPDWTTWALLLGTVAIILWRNIGPLPLMLGGAGIGLFLKGGVLRRVLDLVR